MFNWFKNRKHKKQEARVIEYVERAYRMTEDAERPFGKVEIILLAQMIQREDKD